MNHSRESTPPFRSILFAETDTLPDLERLQPPSCFADLHLGQVVEAVLGDDEYDLQPFFWIPLGSVDAVKYRQDVTRDLRRPSVRRCIETFSEKLKSMREHVALLDRLHYKNSIEGWFLYAVGVYCDAVNDLEHDLAEAELTSRGFLTLRRFLAEYVRSDSFTDLCTDTANMNEGLSNIAYSLTITDDRIRVSDYNGEADFSSDVSATFAKFRREDRVGVQVEFHDSPEMNHAEASLVDMVARLNPEVFGRLDEYFAVHQDYLNATIATFHREVHFYLKYLAFTERFTRTGLSFCDPQVRDDRKRVSVTATFDIALAENLIHKGSRVVCNDFFLSGAERVLVVTGPNQGGKTTFARTFGQLHYLASLGLPVPGTRAELFLIDRLFTHFEKQEDPLGPHGKLEDDLLRVRDILDCATNRSLVILNEIFTSTSLDDGVFLGTRVLNRLIRLDLLCVCVTFLDELASLGEATVSMVSTVDHEDPSVRTLKIVRRPADGLAYAAAIADKYGVSYTRLKERLTS